MEKGSTLRERMALLTPEEEDAVLMTPTEIRKKNSVQTEKRKTTFHSLFMSQAVLCNLPVLILVLVASLDNADKQLMAASFPMIERALGLDVKTLGYFSLFTNLSYALSLPFWGYLVHKFGMPRVHILLAISCVSWGTATLGIALFGHSVLGQALFRSLNGAALGSIMPLSQTLLVDMVDVSMRGRAFGVMAICEKLAGTFATASIVYLDPHWEYPYWGLGFFSVFVGLIACQMLHPSYRALSSKNVKGDDHDESPEMTVKQIIQRIVQLPAFLCMVVQGVFGGTPWDMVSSVGWVELKN